MEGKCWFVGPSITKQKVKELIVIVKTALVFSCGKKTTDVSISVNSVSFFYPMASNFTLFGFQRMLEVVKDKLIMS